LCLGKLSHRPETDGASILMDCLGPTVPVQALRTAEVMLQFSKPKLNLRLCSSAITASCYLLPVNIKQSQVLQRIRPPPCHYNSLCTPHRLLDLITAFLDTRHANIRAPLVAFGKSSVGYLEQSTANVLYCRFMHNSPLPGCISCCRSRDRPFHLLRRQHIAK
jgi:hypothetical protein